MTITKIILLAILPFTALGVLASIGFTRVTYYHFKQKHYDKRLV
jgi:hypothetical protein